MSLTKPVIERVKQIEEKYKTAGQDFESYLDGLLYSNSLTYWDYIHLDTLLSIQNTRTDLRDEKIFITYHQITELYFSLILYELNHLCDEKPCDVEPWLKGMGRINRYFQHLCDSFEIVIKGIDKEEFLKFRMSLLPSSGFQSVQYRQIEISSTSLLQLVKADLRETLAGGELMELYEHLYWKWGNLSMKTGEKTLTLQQFEKEYDEKLFMLAKKRQHSNLQVLRENFSDELKSHPELNEVFARFDQLANLEWPRQHLKAAVYHLHQEPEVIKATGGTNWQDYLPPKKQSIHYFPESS